MFQMTIQLSEFEALQLRRSFRRIAFGRSFI